MARAAQDEGEFASRAFPIREDMALQRREWRAERAVWLAIAVVCGLALLGFFSRGPLSHVVADDASRGFTITYERFVRTSALTRFTFTLRGADGRAELHFTPEFVEAYELRTVQPLPAESRSEDGSLVYVFDVPAATATVSIDAWRRDWGASRIAIATADGAPLTLWQFSYP